MKTAFPILTHQTVYNYDVLNRIKSMNGYYRTGTETALTPSEYNSTYSYDANGNIVSMTNFAKADDGTKKQMDAFSYNYLANTNQLLSVDDDNLLTNNFSGDVDDQQTSNYGYDEIGQLIKDEAEKIEQITWTVTNKVKEVIYKGDLQGKKIRFDYDAMGHRIAKHVTSITGDVSSTYYVLDAQGNAMSTYTLTTKSESTFANKLVLSERNIYGSKRLGIEQLSKIVAEPRIVFTDVPWEQEGPWDFPWGNAPWEPIRWSRYYEDWSWTRNQPTVTIHAYKQEIGDKRYELANHLGNVLNVVTDRKLPVADANDNTKIAYFTADVVSFADYLPYGQLAPNRHGSEGSYRYGFNGMERDDELKGEGDSYTAEFWQYDSRLGRRWNLDPVVKEHESPYAVFANSPIWFSDPNGADTLDFNKNGDITRFAKGGEDVFRKVDENNKVENSLKMPKGTLQYKWQYNKEKDEENKPLKIDVLQIKGNENGKKIFEFLSDNTKVEWSFLATTKGSSENGFITTSHKASSEYGSGALFSKKLKPENYNIISDSHNHPSNTAIPSGSWSTDWKPKGSYGDCGHAHDQNIQYNNSNNKPIIYKIYLPKTKKYITYDENSDLEEYR